MKRYIFLSVWCTLFFSGMNFGMFKTLNNMPRVDERCILNQIVGTIDRDEKTLKKPNQQIVVYEKNVLLKMVNIYLQRQNKSQSQIKICKFKPGQPLNPLKSVGNQLNLLQVPNNENVTEKLTKDTQNGLPKKSEDQYFGLIIEEVERSEDKELKEIINKLSDRFGRMPDAEEVLREIQRKEMMRGWDEWTNNNSEVMQEHKKACENLAKWCLNELKVLHKKIEEEVKK